MNCGLQSAISLVLRLMFPLLTGCNTKKSFIKSTLVSFGTTETSNKGHFYFCRITKHKFTQLFRMLALNNHFMTTANEAQIVHTRHSQTAGKMVSSLDKLERSIIDEVFRWVFSVLSEGLASSRVIRASGVAPQLHKSELSGKYL